MWSTGSSGFYVVRAAEIDGWELYAQLKAPTRVRDISTGEVRYRWSESGSQDHYRHAHVYDHLAGTRFAPIQIIVV
ncbi:MAG TPA: hypothetical protein PLL30_16160 [Candidatus Krumholzibacteria bacterium]|nr:hypothetical protein [Candidatus Krumholzibacteria bacterium]HPD73305.1 hypothetical protein [Candidatus Krumholzibacteria bacterium]HRY42021.1 hypothetical protein [Candidatus Krumholzibacteria bacterium]